MEVRLVNAVLGLHVESEATFDCAQSHDFFLFWIQFEFNHFIIWLITIDGKAIEGESNLFIKCMVSRLIFVDDEHATLVLQHVLIDAVGPFLLLSTRNAFLVQGLVLLVQNVRVALRDVESIAAKFKQDLLSLARLNLDLVGFTLLWRKNFYVVELEEVTCFNVDQF